LAAQGASKEEFLENKVKTPKHFNNKRTPSPIFSKEKKIRKIPLIFENENQWNIHEIFGTFEEVL
jgi:hypothetical protein